MTNQEYYEELCNKAAKYDKYRWHHYPKEVPKDKERVLVANRSPYTKRIRYRVLDYSENLFEVDEYCFCEEKGVPGFWYDDDEWGCVKASGVIAWKRIEPFEED